MRLSNKEINYLGALLHDIGKLIWRSKEVKAGENHEMLGEMFIREKLGKVECLKNDIEEIINAANRKKGKIWKADVITAEEREDSEDKAPRRYLEAITNRVEFENPFKKSKSENYWYYEPKVLSILKEDNFPVDSGKLLKDYQHDEIKYQQQHKEILNQFTEEIELLKNETDFNSFITTFYYLLEKYTSRILSAGYLSHPDISLFDHSRITAALSICFEEGEEDKECLLIKGDISGIQQYIYYGIREMTNIAKKLRGRSFTIQLLTEVISNIFIDQLNLFNANLIYNGGGHFLLLAPNNKSIKELISQIEDRINKFLLLEYTGRISLVLEKEECSGREFINDFRTIYKKLDSKLENKKKNKYREQLEFLFDYGLTANDFRGKEEELDYVEKNIGEKLPKIKYLILSQSDCERKEITKGSMIQFKGLGYYVYWAKDEKELEFLITNLNEKNKSKILKLNDTNFLSYLNSNIYTNIAKGFRFLGKYVPIDSNSQPKSFEELAEEYSKNYPLLGIMRMDVDNLGAIFSYGLKEANEFEKKYTPSRVAYLSRELNWFFTAYINKLAEEHNIYIAYSGGDDVFVVGNWFHIIKFAKKLRDELKEFVCNNEHLSASAGIIFTKPNFPISQAALLAEEQEKLAKNTFPKISKNKVGILDIQLTWTEFSEFISFADRLIEFLETNEGKNIIPRSFLYNIYSLTTNIFDSKGRADIRRLNKAKSYLHYIFARKKVNASVLDTKNPEGKVNKLLYELATKLLLSDNKEEAFKKIKFPLTLVLYKTRR